MSEPVSRRPRAASPSPKSRPSAGGVKPSTLMMGFGYDPVLSRRLAEAADLPHQHVRVRERRGGQAALRGNHRQTQGGATGLVYSRFNGPNQEILEDRLGVWDGAEDALVFSSGMSAICILLIAYCEAGDVIVHSGPLYAASEGFIAKRARQATA